MESSGKKDKATLVDVAAAAGVSVSTASLALNGGKLVKEDTRARILEAAEKLSYIPNASARSLKTQKKKVIGVVRCVDKLSTGSYGFDTTVDTYLSEMLKSIETESAASGYSIMVEWAVTIDGRKKLPELYSGGKVDGVLIVGGIVGHELPKAISRLGVPTVMIGSRNEYFDCVDTDYSEAIRLAVSHLVSLGHSSIAFINGPDVSQTSALKADGYRKGLEEAGLSYDERLVAKSDFSGFAGYKAMASLFSCGGQPTALIAAVDCIAIGAMRFLYELKINCPNDISIVGFEDGVLAEYSIPPLTSVSAQKDELGRIATRKLISRIEGYEGRGETSIVSPHLVIRASTQRR